LNNGEVIQPLLSPGATNESANGAYFSIEKSLTNILNKTEIHASFDFLWT